MKKILLLLIMFSNLLGTEYIYLEVREPNSIARSNVPITSGVPLPYGTQTSDWSLWEDSTEIACEYTVLGNRHNSLLLDFQLDTLWADSVRYLYLKDSAPSVDHSDTLKRTGQYVSNNYYQWHIKANGIIDTVWYDPDGEETFAIGDTLCTGGDLEAYDNSTSADFTAMTTVDTSSWEYDNNIRKQFYVVGWLENSGDTLCHYKLRLEFFAGRSDVRITFGLHNSHADSVRNIKVQNAEYIIGDGGTTITSGYETNQIVWSDSENVTIDIIPSTHYANNSTNNGMLIADWSDWTRRAVVDFEQGLAGGERTRRQNSHRSWLFATAPAWWYAETGALTIDKFGSLDNEIAMYRLEGWTVPDESSVADAHDWDYNVSVEDGIDNHNDPEQDDVMANLLMYLRVGPENGRGYLDRAKAWAWYYKNQQAYRTHGFLYSWDSDYEFDTKTRPEISISQTSADNSYESDFQGARVCMASGSSNDYGADHFWAYGLCDWYLLTGDVEALQTAEDLCELSKKLYDDETGTDVLYYSFRAAARHLWGATRLYEVTGKTVWTNLMNKIWQLIRDDNTWTSSDSTGYYYVDDYNSVSPLQSYMLMNAIYRFYQATGDTNTTAKDRLIRWGKWWALYGKDDTQGFTGDDIAISNFAHSSTSWSSYTVMQSCIPTIAFALDSAYWLLDSALTFWDRGSRSNNGGTWPSYTGTTQFLGNYFDGDNLLYGDNLGPEHLGALFYYRRLPDIALNTWYQVSNTLIDDWISDPNSSDPGTDVWPDGLFSYSGGTQINRDRRGVLIFGGGHNNYYQNCIVFMNADRWEWELLFDTNPKLSSAPGCQEEWSGGYPPSRHSYDGFEVHNPFNLMIAGGGSCACGSGSRLASTWMYDFGRKTWTRGTNFADQSNLDGPTLGNVGAVNEEDGLYIQGCDNYSDFYSYDMVTDDWTYVDNDGGVGGYGIENGAFDPVNKHFVVIGTGSAYRYTYSGGSWSYSAINVSGSFPPESGTGSSYSPGIFWSPIDSLFYCYDNAGGTTVYTLDPSDWSATTISADASNEVTPPSNPWAVYGKFFDIPALPGVLGLVAGPNNDLYLYRYANDPGMPSGAGETPDNDDNTAPTLDGTLTANGNDSTDISIYNISSDMDSCILFYPDSSTAWDTLLNAASLDTTVYSAPGTDSLYYWAIDDSSNVTSKTFLDNVTITQSTPAGNIVKVNSAGTIKKVNSAGTIK